MDLTNKSVVDPGITSSKYFKATRVEFDRDKLKFASIQLREPQNIQANNLLITENKYWEELGERKSRGNIECLEDLQMTIARRFIKPKTDPNTIDRDIDISRRIPPMTHYRQDNLSTRKDNFTRQINIIQETNYDQGSPTGSQSTMSLSRTSPSQPPLSRSQSCAGSSRSSPQSSVDSRSPSPSYRSIDYFVASRLKYGDIKISSIEEEAANALLGLRGSSQGSSVCASSKQTYYATESHETAVNTDREDKHQNVAGHIKDKDDDEYEEYRLTNRLKAKQSGIKKRKLIEDNLTNNTNHGVGSESRPTKKFASNSSPEKNIITCNVYNNSNSTDSLEANPSFRFMFDERSREEKELMLDDLRNTITEEDIKYLRQIHDELSRCSDTMCKTDIPFGFDEANLTLLNSSKTRMIERLEADAKKHPAWWRGCSRCDIIDLSGYKDPIGDTILDKLEEALVNHDLIQAASLARRCRQRNIQLSDSKLLSNLKLLTKNTLQARAKSLISSKTKTREVARKLQVGDVV